MMFAGCTLGMESRAVNANPHLKIRAGRVLVPGLEAKLLALVPHLYPHSSDVGYHLFYRNGIDHAYIVECGALLYTVTHRRIVAVHALRGREIHPICRLIRNVNAIR